jgi:RimJ/RimL family protein N-acetyltransferase
LDKYHGMIEFGNVAHAERIASEAGISFNPVTDITIARSENGELLGGVIFKDYTGRSITIHVAAFNPRWINPDMLWITFHYPFEQLGVQKIFGQVCVKNSRALEFDRKLGFKEEAIIRDVYPDGDMILLGMYRDDCRFLKMQPRAFAMKEPSHGR